MIRRSWQVEEANDATADKAGVVDKPAEADEAQAYEANDAEADEADVADEATETDKADAIDEADEADLAVVADNLIRTMRSARPMTP
jgi:hypothetical protein